MFKYTICFIKKEDKILLLNREKSSWMGSWNGVGGKIEKRESPTECILREVFEETGIKLSDVKYKGVVTWTVDNILRGGMYAFTVEVPANFAYETPRKVTEGILDWKDISWILHPENTGVAANLPKYLPKMLNDNTRYNHICIFKNGLLQDVKSVSLKDQ